MTALDMVRDTLLVLLVGLLAMIGLVGLAASIVTGGWPVLLILGWWLVLAFFARAISRSAGLADATIEAVREDRKR